MPKTHLNMFTVDAFEQRNDGILVEQKPKAEPKHERSQNLWENIKIWVVICGGESLMKLTKNTKLKRQRMYFAQHDPTSWLILESVDLAVWWIREGLRWLMTVGGPWKFWTMQMLWSDFGRGFNGTCDRCRTLENSGLWTNGAIVWSQQIRCWLATLVTLWMDEACLRFEEEMLDLELFESCVILRIVSDPESTFEFDFVKFCEGKKLQWKFNKITITFWWSRSFGQNDHRPQSSFYWRNFFFEERVKSSRVDDRNVFKRRSEAQPFVFFFLQLCNTKTTVSLLIEGLKRETITNKTMLEQCCGEVSRLR